MQFDPTFKYKLKTSSLRQQAKSLYGWYKAIAYPRTRIATEKRKLLRSSGRFEPQEFDLLRDVSVNISSRDGMHAGDTGHYFSVGLSAIRCIDQALRRCSPPPAINKILDLPSGYGRVLRFLAQRFRKAQITACEIDKAAVDYCVDNFGVSGVYSQASLKTMSIGTKFDLIWCGSLITHLNRNAIGEVLDFFHRHSAPGGIVVFTTHGSLAAERIRANPFSFSIAPEDALKLLSSFEQFGFSYAEYPWEGSGYGVSLTSREFIESELAKFNDWHPIYFGQNEWDGMQDVHAVVRKT